MWETTTFELLFIISLHLSLDTFGSHLLESTETGVLFKIWSAFLVLILPRSSFYLLIFLACGTLSKTYRLGNNYGDLLQILGKTLVRIPLGYGYGAATKSLRSALVLLCGEVFVENRFRLDLLLVAFSWDENASLFCIHRSRLVSVFMLFTERNPIVEQIWN